MKSKKIKLAGWALATAMLMAPAANAAELKYNTFEPPRAVGSKEVVEFGKRLADETKGALTLKIFAGGQLLNPFTTLKGIGDGVVDAGFIVPSLVQGQLKATNVIPDLLPYVDDNLVASAASVQTALIDCQECQDEFKAVNVVWLGGHGPTPWNLMCSKQINSLADISGKRVRVTGASATRMIKALGGVAVQLPPTEIAPALQGGQIDCAFGPLPWLEDYALYNSVKSVVDYPFGVYSGLGIYTFNRTKFATFTADEKKVLGKLVSHYVIYGAMAWRADEQAARKKAEAAGIKFWKPGDEFKAKMAEFRTAEQVNIAADMKKRGVADPEKLIKLHLANIEKWRGKVAAANSDPAKLAAELQQEVYAKAAALK